MVSSKAEEEEPYGISKASPFGSNNDDRRQWRKHCPGRGQQDASESEADAGSRNPGSVTEGDGEGKPVRGEPPTQR